MSKLKIYCYVDESGRTKSSSCFTVGILIINMYPEEVIKIARDIEEESGKNKLKWHKSKYSIRLAYMSIIFSHPAFKGNLFYSIYKSDVDYHQSTIDTIAQVLKRYHIGGDNYTLRIYVDALSKTQIRRYSSELRKIGYRIKQVRGVKKEENNPLIRVADALAGFIADTQEEKGAELRKLLKKNTHITQI